MTAWTLKHTDSSCDHGRRWQNEPRRRKNEPRRRQSEPEEMVMWGWGEGNLRCQKSPLCCRLTYAAEFSKIKPSVHIYNIKCIISAHIMCMVHTPFKAPENIPFWRFYAPEIRWSLFGVIRCLKLNIFGDFRRQKTHLFGWKRWVTFTQYPLNIYWYLVTWH